MGNRQFVRRSGTQTPSKLTLLDDDVRQRGMTVPAHDDICKPEPPACNLSAMELSASVSGVGAAWCDRTLMT